MVVAGSGEGRGSWFNTGRGEKEVPERARESGRCRRRAGGGTGWYVATRAADTGAYYLQSVRLAIPARVVMGT